MRAGYILLHRKGITEDEWKHALRTLAWIDLCTLASWDDRTIKDGQPLKRGELVASVDFLAQRWRQNPGTVHRWLKHWKSQGQTQVRSQGSPQGSPQVLFLVNYAKYQDIPQGPSQGLSQGQPQGSSQGIERREKNNSINRKSKKKKDHRDCGDESPLSPLQPHLIPIAVWLITNMSERKVLSAEQLSHYIVRNVKVGKRLAPEGKLIYSLEQIAGACVQAYSDGKALSFKPTLETVEKSLLEPKVLEHADLVNARDQIVARFHELEPVILTSKSPAISPKPDVQPAA